MIKHLAELRHDEGPGIAGAFLVREGGVEPPHPFEYTDLNRARLPIPPLARFFKQIESSGPFALAKVWVSTLDTDGIAP